PLLIGLGGVYVLARGHGIGRQGSFLAASIYMLSSMLAVSVAPGMPMFLCAAFIPWVLHGYRKGARGALRYAGFSGFVLAVMLFDGGVHLVALTVVFLLVYATFDVASELARARAVVTAVAATALAAESTAAVKLLLPSSS